MKYSWEVWHRSDETGLYDNQDVNGWRGYTEAESPQVLAEKLNLPLGHGDQLMIWDTPGVGRLPVLIVKAENRKAAK